MSRNHLHRHTEGTPKERRPLFPDNDPGGDKPHNTSSPAWSGHIIDPVAFLLGRTKPAHTPSSLTLAWKSTRGPEPFLIHWGGPRRSLREVEIQGDLCGQIPRDQMEHSNVPEHPCGDDEQLQRGQQDRSFPQQCCGSVIISLGLQGTEVEWKPCTEEEIYKPLLYTKWSIREEQRLVSIRSRTANQNEMLLFTNWPPSSIYGFSSFSSSSSWVSL